MEKLRKKIPFLLVLLVIGALFALVWKKHVAPSFDIIYTANMEGSILDLPCNYPGGSTVFYTIPQVMQAVSALKKKSENGRVPFIIADGGDSFFGVDAFSISSDGFPVFDMMDETGYTLINPGPWERAGILEGRLIDRFQKYVPGPVILATNLGDTIQNGAWSSEAADRDKLPGRIFRESFMMHVNGKNIDFFSHYEPRESPLLPGMKDIPWGLDDSPPIDKLNEIIGKSTADVKVLFCRVNDINDFADKVKGVDVIIPGNFHDSLKPNEVTYINNVAVLPYINSRLQGAVRIRITPGSGRATVGIEFKKPNIKPLLPQELKKSDEEFRKLYGADYEKIYNAFLGYGSRALTHDLKNVQETPTAMVVADMIRNFARSEVAIINLFSVRRALSGVIRGEYVEWLLPFNNTLVTMDLNGEQIETLMKINLRHNSSFLVMSGAQTLYKNKGRDLEIYVGGVRIDKKKTYRVATNDYLAKGEKLEYAPFRLGKNVHKTGILLNYIFLSHLLRSRYIDAPPERVGVMSRDEIRKIKEPAKREREAFKWGYYDMLIDSDSEVKGPLLIRAMLYCGAIPAQSECPMLRDKNEQRTQELTKAISSSWDEILADSSQGDRLAFQGLQDFRMARLAEAEKCWKEASRLLPGDENLARAAASIKDALANGEARTLAPPIWRKFKGNPQNTGFSPYKGPAGNSVKVAWKFKTFHSNKSSPAISSQGDIYFGGGDGYFYALSKTGKELWKYQVGDYILSSPAIADDGTIYFGGAPMGGAPRRVTFQGVKEEAPRQEVGFLYALDPVGNLKWKFKTGGWVASSPTITDDGRIVVGCNDENLYCIKPDGTLSWKYKTDGKILSSPALSHDGSVYFGSEDCYFYALSPDGAPKWKFKAENKFFSSPSVARNGDIYIGNDDSHLYVFNPKGELLWKKKFPAPITSTVSIGPANGDIYVGCEDGALYRMTADGKEKWRFKGGDEFFSSPIIDGAGNIYIGCEDNFLYAVTSEGKLLWKFETGDYIESTPVISPEAMIYLCGEDKTFYALKEGSGKPSYGEDDVNKRSDDED